MDGLTTTPSQPRMRPRFAMPRRACDCHTHVFGPYALFPLAPGRSYSPVPAPLSALLAVQEALDLDRVVIVQPSVYRTDNACTVAALRALGERGRGVAVIAPDTPHAALRELHEAQIRGVRLNLVTQGAADAAGMLRRMAGLVGALGWHLQLYCALATTVALADTIAALGVAVVLDHFAWPRADCSPDEQGWDVLLGLVRDGVVHVKLSAQHRLLDQGMNADTLRGLTQSLLAANPDRLLWGTDWPHPGAFLPGQEAGAQSPLHDIDDGADLDRLAASVADPALLARILVDNPARLYGFDAGPQSAAEGTR